jgi:uroporphyrin-III C-methyltransferase/precorrin-2 dehydrogenase/sirohydrochlorin ferrochelatase
VAARKATDLLVAGAQVMVISPALHPRLEAALENETLTVRRELYTSGLLRGLKPRPKLVFAATTDPVVNAQVAVDAHAVGAFVDVLDDAAASDFISMARVQRGEITIALATGGASPALSAHLRERIEDFIGDEYTTLTAWMKDSRPAVRRAISTQAERRELWQDVIDSAVLRHLRDGRLDTARRLYDSILNESTHSDE